MMYGQEMIYLKVSGRTWAVEALAAGKAFLVDVGGDAMGDGIWGSVDETRRMTMMFDRG